MPVTVTDALAAACALSLRNVESQLYMLPLKADPTTRAQLEAWKATLTTALDYATGGAAPVAPPVLINHSKCSRFTVAEIRASLDAHRYTVEIAEPGEIWRDGQPWLKVEAIAAQIKPMPDDRGSYVIKGGGSGFRCYGEPKARGKVQACAVALASALNAAEPVTAR